MIKHEKHLMPSKLLTYVEEARNWFVFDELSTHSGENIEFSYNGSSTYLYQNKYMYVYIFCNA